MPTHRHACSCSTNWPTISSTRVSISATCGGRSPTRGPISFRADYDKSESPPPELFAYKLPRPLTPEQMYDSFMVLVPRDVTGQEWSRMATSIDEDPVRMEFVRVMRPPPGSATEFRGSTLQSLQMMNGQTMAGSPRRESNRLLAALDAPFMTDADRTDAIYLAVLSRKPEPGRTRRRVAIARRVQNAARTTTSSERPAVGLAQQHRVCV